MPWARPKHNPNVRPNSHRRGYTRQHEKIRKLVLARDPICKGYPRGKRCWKASTVADHIIPLAAGGAAFDMENLQGLCAACHILKTMDESR